MPAHKVIKRDQLIYSNAIARTRGWKRHFKKADFEDITKFDKEQEWPIVFDIQLNRGRRRILFEHANGELYQLDIPNSVYIELKTVERVTLN